jgi:hypothetical protein
VWAAAAPDARYVATDSLTETVIAQMRTTGALPAVPQIGRWTATGASFFPWYTAAINSTYAFSNNRKYWAAGGGWAAWSPSGPNAGASLAVGFVQMHWTLGVSSSAMTPLTMGGAIANQIPNGVSYANGEFHFLTNDGMWSFPVTSGAPPALSAKRGTSSVGGSNVYGQATYIAGNYTIWATANVPTVPRYAADRATWVNCTVPALNGDGGGAGNGICWIFNDAPRSRLVAITQYGEILTSVDGITFTKTFTRTAGSTTLGLTTCWVSPSGKVFACGSGAGNGQYYLAADTGSAFALQTVVLGGGKTLISRAFDVNGTAGVVGLVFQAGTGTPTSTSLAVSVDDGVTWLFGMGGDGTAGGINLGQNVVLANEGVFATVNGLASTDFGSAFGDRLAADVDAMFVFNQLDKMLIDVADGVTKKRFVRVT